MEPGCRRLLPFSPNIISEVRHWCCAIGSASQLVFQFIPKVEIAIEARGFAQASQVLTHRPWKTIIPLWTSLCATKWKSHYCRKGDPSNPNHFSIRIGERRKWDWAIPIMLFSTFAFNHENRHLLFFTYTFSDGDESSTQSVALCWF